MRCGRLYFSLWFGLFCIFCSYVVYEKVSKPAMNPRIFAVKVTSDDIDMESLAQRVDCTNEGRIGTLPCVYQFRYQGIQKDPLPWMQQQSNDIVWIEEQIPRTRYRRSEL